jgi:hypothetical protein
MKVLALVTLFWTLPASATHYSCDYSFMGFPFTHLEFEIDQDGKPSDFVIATSNGVSHQETLTPDVKQPDQLLRAWLSKESPDNTIELILYREAKTGGNSVLINHNVPISKEVWGNCL